MPRKHLSAALLMLSAPFVTACAHKPPAPPEIVDHFIYPAMPDSTCAPAPAPPAVDASDNAWAAWKWNDHQAGQDCRDKLGAVHSVVSKWPPPSVPK